MIILKHGLNEVFRTLGYQKKVEGREYVLSPYLLSLNVSDGEILYNTLTREVVLSQSIEKDKDELVARWYFLPRWESPSNIVKRFWKLYNKTHSRRTYGPINLFTVLTTTECNARCPYCYECNSKKCTMTLKTAKDAAAYIRARSANNFRIKWFGGEPLCNTQAMDHIALELNDRDWTSSIVTNGYLVDRYSDYLSHWRIKWVQVTLDGMEKTYNQVKGIQGADNAFERVLKNIEILLNKKIEVTVRLNLSLKNADELLELIDLIHYRFGKINVNIAELYEGAGEKPLILTQNDRNEMFERETQLYRKLCDLGLYRPGFPRLRRTHCMADNGRSCVILPDGNLSLCEHHTDDEIYSDIYEAPFNRAVLQSWLERSSEKAECAICPMYTQCIMLAKCPVAKCNQALKIFKAKLAMEKVYKEALSGKHISLSRTDF